MALIQCESEDEDDNLFELIEKITKAISPIIIPVIDSLSSIEPGNIISLEEEII